MARKPLDCVINHLNLLTFCFKFCALGPFGILLGVLKIKVKPPKVSANNEMHFNGAEYSRYGYGREIK